MNKAIFKFQDYPLRAKLLLSFATILLLSSLSGLFSILQQYKSAEITAISQASNLAETFSDIITANQVDLQESVIQIKKLHGSGIVILDAQKQVLADSNLANIGTIFEGDHNGEVTATLKDGQPRTFIQIRNDFLGGIKQVIVPVRNEVNGAIVGAVVVEYSADIQKELLTSAEKFALDVSAVIANTPVNLPVFVSSLSIARKQSMVVVDLSKQILADSSPENINKVFDGDQNGELTATLKDGQPRTFIHIGPNFESGPLQSIAPIKNQAGNIIGAVILGLSDKTEALVMVNVTQTAEVISVEVSQSLARLQEYIIRLHETQGRNPQVVGLDLRVVADANPDKINTAFDTSSEVFATLKDGEIRTFIEKASGDTSQGIRKVVVPIKNKLGRITGAVTLEYVALFDELQQSQNTAVLNLVWFSLAGLAIAFVIGQLIASSIVTPIVQLKNAALKIANGELDAPLPTITSKDEVGLLTGAFNSMTRQLTVRATELSAVAEVGIATATILDVDQLLQEVVDVSKERFNLYHSHIYLLDKAGENLVLVSGAGEAGRQMMADGHSISLDREQSLVARAARDRIGVIVGDVTQVSDFLPNPHLPDTRAELAVPMVVGDILLGVFDFQSNKKDGFSTSDITIYTTLATQVAIALQNARLYVNQTATVTQLRELDRLKSSFLANMSHELRTPLNSILGFSEVILEGLDGELTPYMLADMGLIRKNGKHLLNLINDVLDMAKIESGTLNLMPETVLVHEILDEVTSITSTLASSKHIALFIRDDSDRDIEIYVDRTRLRQVLINIVNNSIKFTEQGKISLHAQKIAGEKILITVKDTGIGIPADKLEVIFQEFAQVDSSATRKVSGTGLGLPISRKLVEMQGGRVWAESSGVDGEGSVFYIELLEQAVIVEQEDAKKH